MQLTQTSDVLGALSSFLCLIHCLATPFVFALQAYTVSSCSDAPLWWQAIDYIFLGIAFFAVWHSTKTTSKPWMVYALWGSWLGVFIVVINHKLDLLPIHHALLYVPAVMLIVLHIINLRHCRCQEEKCCVVEE